MAKVDFPDSCNIFYNPAAYNNAKTELKKAKDKEITGPKKTGFFSILEKTVEKESSETQAFRELPASEESIRILLDDVHSTGDSLKKRPFPEEIIQYKKAVRNFLHYIVENGYAIEEHLSGANILKRKKFTLVQVVDKKLEQLAAGILAGQLTQMNILERVDEINGILVDLLQ